MPSKLVPTHKFCQPLLVGDRVKYAVFRKIPGSQQVAYCKRHYTIQACCDALKKRFPKEASLFTPEQLLLENWETQRTKNAAAKASGKTKRPIKRMEKIAYQGVTCETRPNGRIVWKVHERYNTPQWRYDTQIGAVKAIAKAENCTMGDLKLKKTKLPTLPRGTVQELHGRAMALYHKRYPGDVVNADVHAKCAKTWTSLKLAPGTLPSFFLGKADKDRRDVVDSVAEEWQVSMPSGAKKELDEAKFLYNVLVRAARKISQHRWSHAERKSFGRNNFHWMNYHTMLVHLWILNLKKLPSDKNEPLVFQNPGTKYYVRPFTEAIRKKLDNHIAWGKSCLKLTEDLPETAKDFVNCVHAIDYGLKALVGAIKDASYVRLWLKRAWMRFLLVAYDIKIDFRRLTIREFILCWPDEHGLLLKLLGDPSKSVNQRLASDVGPGLENLHYEDEAELLSMHACLVDDWDAQTVLRLKGLDWLVRNWDELRRRLDQWHRRDGVYPHPGVFFVECWDLP